MNLFDALNVHLAWKLRLREYVDGNSGARLDPVTVLCDECCDLGRWIAAEFPARKHIPEFLRVREVHADFHRCAAEVIELVHSGDTTAAQQLLRSDYAHLSAMVVKAITKLNRQLDEHIIEEEAA